MKTDEGQQVYDFEKMKDEKFPEGVMDYFKDLGYTDRTGLTEALDITINNWIREFSVTVIDVKYQGIADDNNSVSALVIYEADEIVS